MATSKGPFSRNSNDGLNKASLPSTKSSSVSILNASDYPQGFVAPGTGSNISSPNSGVVSGGEEASVVLSGGSFKRWRKPGSVTRRPLPGFLKLSSSTAEVKEAIVADAERYPVSALNFTISSGTLGSSGLANGVGKSISTDKLTVGVGGPTQSGSNSGASLSGTGSSNSNNNSASGLSGNQSSITPGMSTARTPYRLQKFEAILEAENVDLNSLRKLSWNGIPFEFRARVWQLLLGYLPTNKSRREATLNRKRSEYIDSLPVYCDVADYERTVQEGETLRQILVDLPRTCPDVPFFHQPIVQKAMERILYVWAIRHPASGYVQGMNDLLTPLVIVFLQPYVEDVLRADVGSLDPQVMLNVEADSYWCLTKLLDNIQDHYTFSQPGLQRMVMRLEDLVHRMDAELHDHFERENLQYMQFAFRWMNCLLLREVPLRAIVRVWDTYLSEDRGGFESFHVYVCVVLLKTFKDSLMKLAFPDILMFLQELPTTAWSETDVEPLLSQAYILSTLFDDAPSHLK